MDNFEHLQIIRDTLNHVEDNLKALRDNVDLPTKLAINKAMDAVFPLREELQKVDRSLEAGNGF